MEGEGGDARYEFEERDGRRLKYHKGQPGNYVGVTEKKGKTKTSYQARACITKHKGDKRSDNILWALLAQRLLLLLPLRMQKAIRLARSHLRARESPAHVRFLMLATCIEI